MYTSTLFLFVAAASAFPTLPLEPRVKNPAISNCGQIPCTTFDAAEQLVDVSPGSAHPYIAPGPGDIRGPCPGLNAAANHGYFPRNGIPNILQSIDGLSQAFGMGPDLSGFLAAYAVALDGDALTETWSIGGPFPGSSIFLGGHEPQGISFSHNNYESDGSVARGDAYMYNGDAYSLVMSKFEQLYKTGKLYTLESLQKHFVKVQKQSIATNPYYFSGPFSGVLVAPAAHNFIINLMSNHSAEQPSGYLDRPTLKSFFAVTGEPGSFKWRPGQERIPLNWYRRPSISPYSAPNADADVGYLYLNNPESFRLGGNTGKTNSFEGVSVSELTHGTYTTENLMQGNNVGCFAFQMATAALPDILDGLVGSLHPITKLMEKYAGPVFSNLECPQMNKYDQGLFNKFPGYKYHPKGAKTGS